MTISKTREFSDFAALPAAEQIDAVIDGSCYLKQCMEHLMKQEAMPGLTSDLKDLMSIALCDMGKWRLLLNETMDGRPPAECGNTGM